MLYSEFHIWILCQNHLSPLSLPIRGTRLFLITRYEYNRQSWIPISVTTTDFYHILTYRNPIPFPNIELPRQRSFPLEAKQRTFMAHQYHSREPLICWHCGTHHSASQEFCTTCNGWTLPTLTVTRHIIEWETFVLKDNDSNEIKKY